MHSTQESYHGDCRSLMCSNSHYGDARDSGASRGYSGSDCPPPGGSMINALRFDALVQAFHAVLDRLPDRRRGKHIQFAIKDAALGAFAVFFTQSPSFLAHQQTLRHAKGVSHAERLFGMTRIPCDNQIRTLLDPVPPAEFFPLFATITQALTTAGVVDT